MVLNIFSYVLPVMHYDIKQRLNQTELKPNQGVIVNLLFESHNKMAALTDEIDYLFDKTEEWGGQRGYFLETSGTSINSADNYRLFVVYSKDNDYVEGFRGCYFARGSDGTATLQYTAPKLERVHTTLDELEQNTKLEKYIVGVDFRTVKRLRSVDSKDIMKHFDQFKPIDVYEDNGISVFTPDILDWAEKNRLVITEAKMNRDGIIEHDDSENVVTVPATRFIVSVSDVPYSHTGLGKIYLLEPKKDSRLPRMNFHGQPLTVSAFGLSERDVKLFYKELPIQRLNVPYFQFYKMLDGLSRSIQSEEEIVIPCDGHN